MKILFIEDNHIKSKDVFEYLTESYKELEVIIRDSFRGGLREIMKGNYDLLLLDMSIPTWESNSSNQGGYERFGGISIMREMKRKSKFMPVIVITMFNEFGVGQSFVDLVELDNLLKKEFIGFYKGYIKYSSGERKWKTELKNKLDNCAHISS